MRNLNHSYLLVIILALTSCKRVGKNQATIDPLWHKLTLSSGWIIYAPPDFISKAERGIDSRPGIIYSKKDSIFLQYDSDIFERNGISGCDLKSHFADAKASIDTGFYKTFYKIPVSHIALIDTIDNKIAIILEPTRTGKGTVGIEIPGCRKEAWIGITGKNLTADKEKLVLEIYKTLRQTNK
ncbi:MAG TPA: hypothetical protein VHE59_21045 [Mucilaginibacter sp.]|nr:hypothetical protein [Mucilaginibacter sp.]